MGCPFAPIWGLGAPINTFVFICCYLGLCFYLFLIGRATIESPRGGVNGGSPPHNLMLPPVTGGSEHPYNNGYSRQEFQKSLHVL